MHQLSTVNSTVFDALHTTSLSHLDTLLVLMNELLPECCSPHDLRTVGLQYGIRGIEKWNISDSLSKANGYVARTQNGWRLTCIGENHVRELLSDNSPLHDIKTNLEEHLEAINDNIIRGYVLEAITCLEARCYRAAIIMSWEGALALLYECVILNHLNSFNTQASKIDRRWKPAKNVDDLASIGERNFLDIICQLSIIGKSVKLRLIRCLDLRNACGHPNSFSVGEAEARAHVEALINNVFSKYT